jgi:hypothetical protein
VQEFTATGAFARGFRLDPCEGSNDPAPGTKGGIAVTASALYVAHPCANLVQRFAAADLPPAGTGSPPALTAPVYAPHGIAAPTAATGPSGAQAVFVTQPRSSAIRRFDLATMAQIGDAVPITHTGTPDDVHVSANAGEARILVSETANAEPGYAHRVYAFAATPPDAFPELFNFGGPGAAPGRLNQAVALDAVATEQGIASAVVVADRENERLQRLTASDTDNGTVAWVAGAQDPGPPPATGPGGGGGGGGGGDTGDDPGPDNAPSVRINGGARYTKSAEVTLTLAQPRGTRSIEIANDADFARAERFAAGRTEVDWRLERDPPDRVRRRVFVRFAGSGRGVVSDEIRLDRRRPKIRGARIVEPRGGWGLRVIASDSGSGLAELHSAPRRNGPWQERGFESLTAIDRPAGARWVRVADLAGNVSKLERARRR